MKMNKKLIKNYSLVTLGAILSALSLEIFLVPNKILDGGVTGISLMLHHVTGINLSLFTMLLNIPFLLVGYSKIGKRFLFKTLYGITVFSVLLNSLSGIGQITTDVFLATVFGGIMLGTGVGLVIRGGGCLDGSEVVAILLSKDRPVSVGQIVLYFNIVIYGMAGFLFGWDRAMYSLVMYIITFFLIDKVSEGFNQAKACIIITEEDAKIKESIYTNLGRTVTYWTGKGLVSDSPKKVLMVVVSRVEVSEIRQIAEDDDESAFVVVLGVEELFGDHIKKVKKEVVNDFNI